MPNWCTNNLFIKGPKKDLQKIVDTGFSLQKLLPCPKELLDTVSGTMGTGASRKAHELQMKNNILKYGYKDWYSWSVSNWGTKWDVGPVADLQFEKNGLYINFESAWGPPEQAIRNLSEKFPKCYFNLEYIETGCRFVGFIRIDKGGVEDSDYLDYTNSKELLAFGKANSCDIAIYEAEYVAQDEENEEANQENA
jgi:hypothetical protein